MTTPVIPYSETLRTLRVSGAAERHLLGRDYGGDFARNHPGVHGRYLTAPVRRAGRGTSRVATLTVADWVIIGRHMAEIETAIAGAVADRAIPDTRGRNELRAVATLVDRIQAIAPEIESSRW